MFKESKEFQEFVNFISSKGNVLGVFNQTDENTVELFFGNGKTKTVKVDDMKKYHNKIILLYADIPVEVK